MVAEPKPHQTGRKRQNITKTGNDWDYYYDSYYASTVGCFPPIGPSTRLVPPLKRARISTSSSTPNNGGNGTNVSSSNRSTNKIQTTINSTTNIHSPTIQQQQQQQKLSNNNGINAQQIISNTGTNNTNSINQNNSIITNNNTIAIDQLKTYSNPDILICGNCREMLTELKELIEHKKTYCKLRFTCKCHTFNSDMNSEEHTSLTQANTAATTVSLLCVQCKDSFPNAWDLMVHAQAAHMVNIYELGLPKQNNSSIASNNGNDDHTLSELPLSSRENSEEKENNKNGSSTSTTNGIDNNSSEEYENVIMRSDSPTVNSNNHLNSIDNDVTIKQEPEMQKRTAQNCSLVHTLTINTMENDDDDDNSGNNKNITSLSSTTRPMSTVTDTPSSYQLFVTNGEQ